MSDQTEHVGERRGMSTMRIAILAFSVVMVAFIVLLATRDVQVNGPNFEAVGKPAPPVEGVSYDGQSFDLDEILLENRRIAEDQGTWVFVNFFASWCTPCIEENPELIRLDEEGVVKPDGTVCPSKLVGVAINDTAAEITKFFDRYGGDWPVIVGDVTSQILIDYSATQPPETLVIHPNGTVVQKFIGAQDYETLTRDITC